LQLSKATSVIEEYVNQNYGDLITVAEPYYHSNNHFWLAELKSDYPRFIHDDKNPKTTIVKYLTLKKLGEVRLSDDNKIDATPRNELVSRLHETLQQWREQVEGIILSTSSDKLAKIGALKDVLNPIVIAVDYFSHEGVEILPYSQIRKDPRSKKMLVWLRFLSQVGLLEEKGDGFGYGPKFAEMFKRLGNKENLTNRIISYIMREHYSAMRQMLEVSRFDPYLHMETCYYAPCIQAGRLLYRKEETLLDVYHQWYPRYPDYRLSPILGQLKEVGLLRKEGEYWYGDEDTWGNIDPLKKEVPEVLEPLRA
jgi:hypothetical protein